VALQSTGVYWIALYDLLQEADFEVYLVNARYTKSLPGLVKRLVAQELVLSFVPDEEQRLWRTVMRRKYQLTRNRV